LGKTDVGIIRYRRQLRAAIAAVKEGRDEDLPMYGGLDLATVFGPVSNDSIAQDGDWERAAQEADLQRRGACSWDAKV
jgi:phthalate 4,5-dioxygenase oxygenase subunit